MKCYLKVEYNDIEYDAVNYYSANFITENMEWICHDNDGDPEIEFIHEVDEEYKYQRLIRFLKTYPEYDPIRYTK